MNEITDPGKLSKEAKSRYQKGDYLEAASHYQAAQRKFLELNDRLNAAEMANNASVAYLQADKAEEAYSAAKGTPEVFAELGDLTRQGMAVGNLASAAESLGKEHEASDLFQTSRRYPLTGRRRPAQGIGDAVTLDAPIEDRPAASSAHNHAKRSKWRETALPKAKLY